jgi:hypothetical protein
MKDLAVASPAAVGYCDNDSVTVRHGESGNGEEGRKVRREYHAMPFLPCGGFHSCTSLLRLIQEVVYNASF